MKTILITGFDPFGGESINPAWEAVKTMEGYTDGGYTVVTQMVPTVRYNSVKTAIEAAEKCNPDFILCVGQAGGRPDITIERVAINCDDFRIPDNGGNQPTDEPVVADGPSAYFATLPIKDIVNALHQVGIPAKVSNTAGTFVCNHIMYGVSHYAAQKGGIKVGFMHIPYLPSQVVNKPDQPSMAVETVRATLETIVHVLAHGESYEAQHITYTTPHE